MDHHELPPSPFSTDLVLEYTLQAAHSLDTREELHGHLWKFELTFTGEPVRGRIIDLPLLEDRVAELMAPFQNTTLNGNPRLTVAGREFPTCETLGESFFLLLDSETLATLRADFNPTLRLVSVKITLFELDGRNYGSAITRIRTESSPLVSLASKLSDGTEKSFSRPEEASLPYRRGQTL